MRLIDADEAKRAICQDQCELPDGCGGSCEMTDYIEDAPTVEAEPVRHGHWIDDSDDYSQDYYECSVCGHLWVTIEGTPQDNEMNYCPYCGAHMNEVSE